MSNQSKSRQISDFLSQTALPSDTQLTYISGGVNYRISLTDFLSSIGVSGSIVQDGDSLGTPILNTAGSINNIRNLEPGAGIKTSVSPQNGATIEHNFKADVVGAQVVNDLTLSSPTFRSLVAGSGVSVSQSGNEIQIALTGTPASTKTVIVNSISDFPAAVAGVITLNDDTEYLIRNDISTSNRFVLGSNCVLDGASNIVIALTYTGTGVMFTSANKSWTIRNISAICLTGTFAAISGTGSETFQMLSVNVKASTLGTASSLAGFHIHDTEQTVTTNGFVFSGSNNVALIEASLSTISAGVLYDLGTSTFSGFSITDNFTTINGTSVFLSGAASSANMNAGSLGSVHNCRFFGTGTPLQTITTADSKWQFFLSDKIKDTTRDCLMSQVANATNTVITTVSTPVKLLGAWTEELADSFTTDATGKIIYTGLKDVEVNVDMSFTGAAVSGGSKDFAYYVAKNGATITNSGAANTASSSVAGRTSLMWRLSLVTNDYIEAFVENNTDTIDMLITNAVIRIA